MKKILIISALVLVFGNEAQSQNIEAQILLDNSSTTTNSTVSFRVRTKVGTQAFVGVSMYFVYQQANLAPQTIVINNATGVNDALLTTTYGWGIGTRTITPFQSITPVVYDGQSYNRRYVYLNTDETGGANVQTLTTSWVTLFSVTFNNLQATFPQGGFGYLQETTEFFNASLTDEIGNNLPIDVTTGSTALGIGTLPVTFSSFDVKCNDKGALVSWTTATEANSQKFEIQRSTNSNDWITIDNIAAAGNSNMTRNYQYLDLNGGVAYYRIRQVDIDGRATYTAIRQTNCTAGQFDVVLYPVPTRDNLTVVIKSGKSVRTELQIMDLSGRTIRRIPAQINSGNNTINLDVSRIPAGQYMLVSSAPEIEISKKFTVIR